MLHDERLLAEDELGEVALAEKYVLLRARSLQRVVSFAPYGGGIRDTKLVVIHEVRNADLPLGFDPQALLNERMGRVDARGVGMLTSRTVASAELGSCAFGFRSARVLVTAGMSNAVRVGDEPGPLGEAFGTINIVAQLDGPLEDEALLEALSIVAEARTCAVIEAGVRSRRSAGVATGTGTDCIAVLAPALQEGRSRYAGKHTDTGHVLGAATYRGVTRAITRWKTEQRK
ncbi:MAG TPA: adenosylcobinamide amidohydrolase [Polyangiales bacterium]|jgi:adenosylcobinamide amidohydrolase|nr:adenosylcobinamide amidohydrolase [Polyangiales bacterium]